MTNKFGRTGRGSNNLKDELIGDELPLVTKVGVSLRQQNDITVRYIFNKKESVANIDALILFILRFLCVCNTSHLKILWEKEKLLVTIYFSFSHSVLYQF